jgi:thymidylate synthase (FAD)
VTTNKHIVELDEDLVDLITDDTWFNALVRLRNHLKVFCTTNKQIERQKQGKKGLLVLINEWSDMKQMKVELLKNTGDDLFIANVARVSFDKWNEKLDEVRDPKLLDYLAHHQHISPFFHVRVTMRLPTEAIDLYKFNDPTYLMGAVWKLDGYTSHTEMMVFQHSVYGWIRMLADGMFDASYIDEVYRNLKSIRGLTHTFEAYKWLNLDPFKFSSSANNDSKLVSIINENSLNDPLMVNASLRITVPISIARQLFTHRMLASNEVSRRYVSTPPDFYMPTEWRSKPEGSAKQGSGSQVITDLAWGFATLNASDSDSPNMSSTSNIKAISESYVDYAQALYNVLIESDVAPEQARLLLPQSMMTTIVFTGSIETWWRLYLLRSDLHAQKEVREVAEMIKQTLTGLDKRYTEV